MIFRDDVKMTLNDTALVPADVRAFFVANGLSLDALLAMPPPPRSFWVRPSYASDAIVEAVRSQTGTSVEPARFPVGFFEMNAAADIAHVQPYKQGQILCMDTSSAVAVACLDVQDGDDCLDVCAAPGMKLAMLADIVGADGSVTGVDLSAERLAGCRTLVRKHRLGRVRLYRADGRTFDVEAPAEVTRGHIEKAGPATAAAMPPADDCAGPLPYDAPKLLRNGWAKTGRLYDRVLVDAECTHDGSIRHLQKAASQGWAHFVQQSLDPERLRGLPQLQLALLRNGFRLLQRGGTFVYSTCSLTRAQNEAVLEAFLRDNPFARLEPALQTSSALIDPASIPPQCILSLEGTCTQIDKPHILRFDPGRSQTSGLFIAKIVKL